MDLMKRLIELVSTASGRLEVLDHRVSESSELLISLIDKYNREIMNLHDRIANLSNQTKILHEENSRLAAENRKYHAEMNSLAHSVKSLEKKRRNKQ